MENNELNPAIRLEWFPKEDITVWELAQAQSFFLLKEIRLSNILGIDFSVMRHFNVINPSGMYRKLD